MAERPAEVAAALDRLADAVAERVDLESVVRLARTAPDRPAGGVAVPPRVVPPGRTVRVAVAAGAAFTFTYADTLDALGAAGVEVVPVDPAHDAALPGGTSGLIAGGGFPEVHATDLASERAAAGRRPRPGVPRDADLGRVRGPAVAVPHARRRTAGRGRAAPTPA